MRIYTRFNLIISLLIVVRLARFVVQLTRIILNKRTAPAEPHSLEAVIPDLSPVSIIIPAWNEETVLSNTLDSLLQIDSPSWQIIIVAGGSDRTYEIAIQYQQNYPKIKVVEQLPKGKNAALNQGLRFANGEIIVFLDADCLVEKDWLQELVRPLNQGYAAVCSNFFPINLTQVSQYFEIEKVFYYELKKENILHGHAIALGRELLDQLGEMDEAVKVGVDWDLDQRVLKLGAKRLFSTKSRLKTYITDTPLQFLKDEIRWRQAFLLGLLEFRTTRHGLRWLRAFLPYLNSVTIFLGLLLLPVTLVIPTYRKKGFQLLWLIISLMSWTVMHTLLRTLAVLIYTGEKRWVSSLWSGPLLALISSLADSLALLTFSHQNPFFKGPRPKSTVNPDS